MTFTFLILLFLCLLAIAKQDFKDRQVHVGLLLLFAIGSISHASIQLDWSTLLLVAGMNAVLITIQLGVIAFYFKLKKGTAKNLFKEGIGLGDLFFFIGLIFWFSPLNLLVFLSINYLMLLLGFALYSIKNKQKSIPLAGGLSLGLGAFILAELCSKFSTYYVDLIIL